MTALLASTNSPLTSGAGTGERSAQVLGYRTPTVVLALVLLYTLLFTQIIDGSFSLGGDVDSTLFETASRSNTINQAFWFLLLACSIALVIMRKTDPFNAARACLPLLVYLLWSAAVLPWAADRHIALRRLLLQFCIVGSVWLPIATIRDATHVRRILLYTLFAVVLINAAAIPVLKPTALGYAGLFSQKNSLGAVAAIAFITFLFGLPSERPADRAASVAGLALSLALLVLSKSKTSMILASAVPLMTWIIGALARSLRFRPAAVTLTIAAVSACATVVALSFGMRSDVALHMLFGGDTFTGRTAIWSFAWTEFLTRPLIGFGFNGFWGVGANSAATYSNNAFFSDILQAHQGYLDVLLETGVTGFVIFVALLLAALRNCSRVLHLRGGGLFLAITLFFIFHNFFESSAFRRFEPAWVVFLFAATAAGLEPPRTRSADQRSSREAVSC
ncbi:MAG: O-antigen ligase family protein [Alphaproteobacteria bacterium]|nr:O-antigen ligase family protein [Alphaproteobacteria bacterium]